MSNNQIVDVKVKPTRMLYPPYGASNNNDYKIYACETESENVIKNKYGNITIKGEMQRLELYQEYDVQLTLNEIHPTYGASYNILSPPYQPIGEGIEGQKSFLSTLLTPLQVEEIYKVYPDEDIVQLFVDDKFDYKIVRNFGPTVYERVKQKIVENVVYRDILTRLGKYGISYDTILKLEEIYGNRELIIQKLEENPYTLTKIQGWGFKKADKIAQLMGVKEDNPFRIQYGIRYTLEQNEQKGHTYMSQKDLMDEATNQLNIETSLIHKEFLKTPEIKVIDEKVSLMKTYNAEKYIAQKFKDMLSGIKPLNFDPEEFIDYIERTYSGILKNGLTDDQKNFFRNIQKNSVNLLVGYAGTGKSQLQKFLLDLLHKFGMTYVFLSPSAKAAKVTKMYTGADAQTMHRRLKYTQNQEEAELLEIVEDFVLIDESGMADVFIISKLLSKITNPNTRILFVGDDFQLASIQAGNFLYDAINSGVIPLTKLTKVFRQEEGGILDVATKIREGKKIVENNFVGTQKFGEDFFLHCMDQSQMESSYQQYYDVFLKNYSPKDIMVLSPTKKGRIGTVAINQYIQSKINPKTKDSIEHSYGENGENIIRVGDYVLNTVNKYAINNMEEQPVDVVNGDTGDVIEIKLNATDSFDGDLENGEESRAGIVINFDGVHVKFGFDTIFHLLHAWSYTIHKSQGSAAEAVICIADKAHKFQLTANLIYTAITRAKKRCILLTQAETLNYAIRKVEGKRRNTHLQQMLEEVFAA